MLFLPTSVQTSGNVLDRWGEMCERREFSDQRASSRNRARRRTKLDETDPAGEIGRYGPELFPDGSSLGIRPQDIDQKQRETDDVEIDRVEHS